MQEELNLPREDFDRHCSDLYVVDRPGVVEWVKANLPNIRYTYFVSPSGQQCIELHFAEMDLWERIQRHGTEASLIAAAKLSANAG